jgi:hypothetical protein
MGKFNTLGWELHHEWRHGGLGSARADESGRVGVESSVGGVEELKAQELRRESYADDRSCRGYL